MCGMSQEHGRVGGAFRPTLVEGTQDDLALDESELLLFYRKIWDEKLRGIAVQQVRSIAEVDIKSYAEGDWQTCQDAETGKSEA